MKARSSVGTSSINARNRTLTNIVRCRASIDRFNTRTAWIRRGASPVSRATTCRNACSLAASSGKIRSCNSFIIRYLLNSLSK